MSSSVSTDILLRKQIAVIISKKYIFLFYCQISASSCLPLTWRPASGTPQVYTLFVNTCASLNKQYVVGRSRFMTREGSKAVSTYLPLRRVFFQLLIGLRTPSQERSSVSYLFIKVQWITYGFVGGATIARWINLRFPFSNSRGPGVESQAHRLRFFRDEWQIIFVLIK